MVEKSASLVKLQLPPTDSFFFYLADELDNQYSHNEAVRDMHLGFRAALWMALFGFLASAVHRNLDSLDHCAMRGQDYTLRCMQHARCVSTTITALVS